MNLPLNSADLQGLSRLAVDGVVGVTDVVEEMHHTIAQRAGLRLVAPSERPGGITGLVYRSVKGTTRLVGRTLEALWSHAPLPASAQVSPQREALVAAINGAWGDHLEATGNPLAIPMGLHVNGRLAEAPAAPTGRIAVLVHGLAMNDLQWTRKDHDHGRALARDAGFTPVYALYNTGRAIATNGQELAQQLQALVAQWPVPVQDLVLVCHSMGGLVARSACSAGEGMPWRRTLSTLVCLGTPHHGAPLERGGHLVDGLLGWSAYAAPLARVGRSRSAGINDLRHGLSQPWPGGVKCCVVAATTSASVRSLRSSTLGDGLVTIGSALGEHQDPRRSLHVPEGQRMVLTKANHWDLLSSPEVYERIAAWVA